MPLPLPAPTFVRMADVAVTSLGAALINNFLDAVYLAGSPLTDYRGTSVPSTHRWTWTQRQAGGLTEAVTITAPAGTPMGKAPAIIVAGRASVNVPAAPVPAAPDVMFNSLPFIGLSKNAGAYVSWDAALPFGVGSSHFGYWRMGSASVVTVGTVIRTFVSPESIIFQIIQVGGVAQTWAGAGAIVEPYDADTTLSGETDCRLYGQFTNGSSANVNALWLSAADIFAHSGVASAPHFGWFTPGGSTIVIGGRLTEYLSGGGTAANLVTPSGVFAGELMPCAQYLATFTPSGPRVGTIRGVYPAGSVQSGRYLRNGATDLYHYVSTSTIGPAHGFMLPASP